MTIGWGLVVMIILFVLCGFVIFAGQYTDYSGYFSKNLYFSLITLASVLVWIIVFVILLLLRKNPKDPDFRQWNVFYYYCVIATIGISKKRY